MNGQLSRLAFWTRDKLASKMRTLDLRISIGILDQIILSGSTLIVSMLLARTVSVEEFGTFTLIFSGLLFVNAIQSSLITGPHSVLSAGLDTQKFSKFTTDVLVIQAAFAVASCLPFFALCALGLNAFGLTPRRLFLSGLVSLLWQNQEFARRVLYARNAPASVLKNDMATNVALLGILVASVTSNQISIEVVLSAMACSYAIGLLIGIHQTSRFLTSPMCFRSTRQSACSLWHYGKWLMGSTVLAWSSSQSLPVMVASLAGLQDTAAIRVSQTLLGPTQVYFRFLETSLTPLATKYKITYGNRKLRSQIRVLLIGSIAGFGGLFSAIVLFGEHLLGRLFGSSYEQYSAVLALISVSYLIQVVINVLALGLRANQASRPFFKAGLVSTVVFLTAGPMLTLRFQAPGAAIALILSNAVTATVLLNAYAAELVDTDGDLDIASVHFGDRVK